MKIGIVQRQNLATSVQVLASTVLVDVPGFTVPVVADGRYKIFIWCPFQLQAAGGFKFRLDMPAHDDYQNSQLAYNLVAAPPVFFAGTVIDAPADFANAAAVAGVHLLTMEAMLRPAANGTLKLQVACNSAAGEIGIFNGYFEVITL